jgi:hypothetical protein
MKNQNDQSTELGQKTVEESAIKTQQDDDNSLALATQFPSWDLMPPTIPVRRIRRSV